MVVLQEFNENLKSICTDSTVIDLLSHQTLQKYISACVKVCLYMIASDPPVVIIAPGWQRAPTVGPGNMDSLGIERDVTLTNRDTETDSEYQQAPKRISEATERTNAIDDKEHEIRPNGNNGQFEMVCRELEKVDQHTESNVNDNQTALIKPRRGEDTCNETKDDNSIKVIGEMSNINGCEVGINVDTDNREKDVESNEPTNALATVTADKDKGQKVVIFCEMINEIEEAKKLEFKPAVLTDAVVVDNISCSSKKNKVDGAKRDTFNKTWFKEYTQRGMFMKFIVWPYMLLHENGPLLCKGVAQGTDEKIYKS